MPPFFFTFFTLLGVFTTFTNTHPIVSYRLPTLHEAISPMASHRLNTPCPLPLPLTSLTSHGNHTALQHAAQSPLNLPTTIRAAIFSHPLLSPNLPPHFLPLTLIPRSIDDYRLRGVAPPFPDAVVVFFSVGVLFTLIVVLKIKRPCSDDWFQSDGRYWRGYDEAEVSRRRRRRRAGGGEVEGAEGEGGDGGGESREENEESEWEGDEEGADSMGYINIMMAPLSRTEQWAKPGW